MDIGGPFCRFKYEPINLNSHDQVKDYLLSKGWVPTEWNYKTDDRGYTLKDLQGNPIRSSPKLTEDSFASVEGDIPRLVARRAILLHRRRCIANTKKNGDETGWLNLVREDGRISACGIPQATNTGRYRHSGIVNVPNANAIYGPELRSLFIVPQGKVQVGVDAQALEARMEAHYCLPYPGGVEYAHDLIDGDIHSKNAAIWGCSRNDAKSPKYAMTYGAQPPKLAATMKVDLETAQKYYNAFWEHNTALKGFRDAITAVWEDRGGKKGGYLRGLDGRKLFARSPHALVNMMFQSAGSIIVKTATVFLDKWVREYNLNAHQIIHYHDEFQYEVAPKDVDRFKELALLAFKKAGEFHKMNVPVLGDAKVGGNWYECH